MFFTFNSHERQGIEQNWSCKLYNRHLELTELTNAGKRGKTCLQINAWGCNEDLFLCQIRALVCESENIIELIEKLNTYRPLLDDIEVRHLKGVDVISSDNKPIKIFNSKVSAEFDFNSFVIRDLEDRNNEPTIINCREGKTKVQKVYKWAKDNINLLKDKSFDEIHNLMIKDTGVYGHYYCAMD